MVREIPIHESFLTWQGEGLHMGRSAYFIRTFGCPVHCPWCDSAGTWHKDYVPKDIKKLTPKVLADDAARSQPDFVVITGGEPTVHNLTDLTTELHNLGLQVHLETSGAFKIKGDFDWITLSPKKWRKPLPENISKADELKIIVDRPEAIREWIEDIGDFITSQHIWLHPEWSKHQDKIITDTITQWVKDFGHPYRAGYQLHKMYMADSLDSGSRPNVPLGGNKSLGY